MEEHQEIAIDLGQLPHGSFPTVLNSLKRRDKKHKLEEMGFEPYEVPAESALLVKALEIGYVRQLEDGI